MKILIGTKNPGKIEGAKQAFEKYFDNVVVNSDVTEEIDNSLLEVVLGAKEKVRKAMDELKVAGIDVLDKDVYLSAINYFDELVLKYREIYTQEEVK